MIRIAVVGDIGSGKSYCAKLFGYPVFNADIEVSKIYKKDKKCYKKFKKALPKYINFFPIKKKELNKAIMANKTNLKKIIRIVHPEIRARLRRFVIKHKYKKFIVLDIPLLIENKINKKSDILVFVDSKRSEINKRLKKRPNYNASIFRKLKKLQLPLEIKKKKSNFIIKNNFMNNLAKKNVKYIRKNIL
tara:strand:- start:527 stop:1096 length:570 start_codon:yes stop_codon:yes gene_type:complete